MTQALIDAGVMVTEAADASDLEAAGRARLQEKYSMNRAAVTWMVGALAVVGLAAVSVTLGMTLLPSRTAVEEAGTLAPWLLTWGLVLTTALLALALAGFLLVIGVSRSD